LGFAEENKIVIIETPLNASMSTPAQNYLANKCSESTDFHGELQKHFKKSSDLLKKDIYCLSPFSGLSHVHLQIQTVFPVFKKFPYIPILYHFIPYLIYGEDVFENTAEYINRYFAKDSSIILLSSKYDYPQEETDALAYNLHQHGFKNISLKTIAQGEVVDSLVDVDLEIAFSSMPMPYTKASLNKQWWIDQLWFRFLLRFSRSSLVFLFFVVPFFILSKKKF
jgi:hypothetical protein